MTLSHRAVISLPVALPFLYYVARAGKPTPHISRPPKIAALVIFPLAMLFAGYSLTGCATT